MAWCRQAANHNLVQYWPRSISPNSVTGPQWANWYVREIILKFGSNPAHWTYGILNSDNIDNNHISSIHGSKQNGMSFTYVTSHQRPVYCFVFIINCWNCPMFRMQHIVILHFTRAISVECRLMPLYWCLPVNLWACSLNNKISMCRLKLVLPNYGWHQCFSQLFRGFEISLTMMIKECANMCVNLMFVYILVHIFRILDTFWWDPSSCKFTTLRYHN